MSEQAPTTAQQRLANFDKAKAANAEQEYAKVAYGDAGVSDFGDEAKKRLEDQAAYEAHMAKFENDDRDSLDRHIDAVDSGETKSKDDARLRFMARLALEIEQMEQDGGGTRVVDAASGRTVLDDKKDRLQELQDQYAHGVTHEKSPNVNENTSESDVEEVPSTDTEISVADKKESVASKERLKSDRYPIGRVVYVSGRAQNRDTGEAADDKAGFRQYVVAARSVDGKELFLMSPRGELVRIDSGKMDTIYESAVASNIQRDDYDDQDWIDGVKTIRKPLLSEDKSKPGQYKLKTTEWEIVDPNSDNPFVEIHRDTKVELIHKGIANLWNQLELFQKSYDNDRAIEEIKKIGGLPSRGESNNRTPGGDEKSDEQSFSTLEQLKFGLKWIIEKDKELSAKHKNAIMSRLRKSETARRAKAESQQMKSSIRERYGDSGNTDRTVAKSKLKSLLLRKNNPVTALARERDNRLKKKR